MTTPTSPPVSRLPLGRRPDDYSKPKLDLTELAATADFSTVPAAADYVSPLSGRWAMLGNGPDPSVAPGFAGCGDCEAARWANHRLLMGAGYPTWAQVLALYRTQNPNFDPAGDPASNGPGSPADGGMATDALCDYLHTHGGPDGARLLAYGTIDPANTVAVQRAIGIFGAVWLDILVQPGNQTEFAQRRAWTNTGEDAEGAHAILGGGYTPGWLAVTWADVIELADSFWTGHVPEGALVERVYLPIWPEHATHAFIASTGAAQLAADYQALTGRPLVWPNQPTPPAPPPSPPAPPAPPVPPAPPTPTPGGGASFQVDDPTVVARVDAAATKRGLTPDEWLTRHLERYFRLAEEVAADFALDLP